MPLATAQESTSPSSEANATLPLLRAIVRDITELARDLRDRHERLDPRSAPAKQLEPGATRKNCSRSQPSSSATRNACRNTSEELRKLGVELKDYFTGLIDFPCLMDGREVYLCWRLGEPEVAHWHELDAGFAGRQKLLAKRAWKRDRRLRSPLD